MSLLQVSGLTIRFPGQPQPVLAGLHFRLEPGERVLLLGPSGSGKSSLLLALMGLVPRSVEAEVAGQVLLDGRPVSDLTPAEICRRMGLLFQEPESQFCMLWPEDEVAFGLENLAVPPNEMPGRIRAALDSVGLGGPQRATRIDRLSGGQQQRLALATILAQAPDLILLDEPTANLDPRGRREVVSAVSQAVQQGKGLLVVAHNLDPWLPLLDRLLLLTPGGRLLDDGPPGELFERWGRYLDEVGVWRPRATRVAEELATGGFPRPEAPAVREGTPAVAIHHLRAGYPGRPDVLRGISLTVRRGEFLALLGPNGSGKSTLARTLIGMVKPAEGSVSLLGDEVRTLRPRQRAERVGYVFQNPEHQFVADSVWEELAYSVRQLRLEPAERRERIESALAFFGLEHLKAANPFTLSGGQKRRLSVATMLVGGQQVLVLDEPTFGQDQRSAERLMQRIAALNRSGVTVLMITHDVDLVDRYATQAAVLADGALAFTGPPEALWRQPDLLFRCGLELPVRLQVLGVAGS